MLLPISGLNILFVALSGSGADAGSASNRSQEDQDKPELDLILYGATGCVGRLAAAHLASQESLQWAVAGRNESKLYSLVSTLEQSTRLLSRPKVIVASLDTKHDPASWVRRTRTVATAAGPYSKHGGESLVRACAELGVHYVDISDEFYWQRQMIDRYDAVARASGASIVLASGFSALAGDLAVQLVLQQLKVSSINDIFVDAWLERYNGGSSHGVLNTIHAQSNASFPHQWASDPYVLAPTVQTDLRVDASLTGLKRPMWDDEEGLIVPNVFGPYDARVLRRTFAELNQKVHLREGAPAKMYAKWSAFLLSHPFSWKSLGTCPTQHLLKDGSWELFARAKQSSIEGEQCCRAVRLSGSGDPGYRFTALGLAEVALCLSGHTADCLSRSTQLGGVLTPGSAVKVVKFKQRLEEIGLVKLTYLESNAFSLMLI